jgi:hypothetical protein
MEGVFDNVPTIFFYSCMVVEKIKRWVKLYFFHSTYNMPTVYGDDNEEIKNYELMATKEYCNFLWQLKKCYKF